MAAHCLCGGNPGLVPLATPVARVDACACAGGTRPCTSPRCCQCCIWQGKDYGHSRRRTAFDNAMDLREEKLREQIAVIEHETASDFGV